MPGVTLRKSGKPHDYAHRASPHVNVLVLVNVNVHENVRLLVSGTFTFMCTSTFTGAYLPQISIGSQTDKATLFFRFCYSILPAVPWN
jgi:hypothetical protein